MKVQVEGIGQAYWGPCKKCKHLGDVGEATFYFCTDTRPTVYHTGSEYFHVRENLPPEIQAKLAIEELSR